MTGGTLFKMPYEPIHPRLTVIGLSLLIAVALSCASEDAPQNEPQTAESHEPSTVVSVAESPATTMPTPPFVGLHNYRYGDPSNTAALVGTLIIHVPCVYIDNKVSPDDEPSGRVLLGLPRDYTRYVSETKSIQVADAHPVSHGDFVIAGGGDGIPGNSSIRDDTILRKYFDSCTANGSFETNSLSPARKRGSAGGWTSDNR